ncbi:hypothetical protein B7R77_07590 [Ralstonia solanacearum K60]|uniref:DUF596 domain-containing protein n=2 Tax=Ralstonia solanacearum TaxID=305 RepID=A0AAP7ZMC7_RALSL|nr:DUF596 domain-containing protein [Ralstonia solanacearum]OYQ13128.1 hypothetical protein B7R77_07590 [Ralstonia solanacearum K60]RIJ87181.1 DUF596 domain-containing protein [Ralstonia solanacearum]
MLSNERYRFIVDHTKGMALDAVWLYLEDDSESYEDRQGKFLWMLERMVSDGIVIFAKNGSSIEGKDAVEKFRGAFPEDDENVNNGVWFFTDLCPAGIGWVMPDGSIDWV